MVTVGFRHLTNLKGDKGDKGAPGTFARATVKTLPADASPNVTMSGPETAREVHFELPRGLPGTNGVDTDEAVSEYVKAEGTRTRSALREIAPTVVGIDQFVQDGEVIDPSGLSTADNSKVFQRAVDQLNALYEADGVPRQVYWPDGTYWLSSAGNVPGSATRYAVRWRSGVGIATSSQRGVVFLTPADASAFVAADNATWENLRHVYCDPHVVDGQKQSNETYTSKFKGWFIQGLADSSFTDVCIRNTFSTGFGCDYLQRVTVTGEADNCGRGVREKGIDPLTTSGASGFGIGTGRHEIEDFTLDVVARNCGFHGVFTETQGAEPYTVSKGGRINALVEGNYVGFRDCGCEGLQASIVSRGNIFAEVYHAETVLNGSAGMNGRMKVDLADGNAGILFGPNSVAGRYRFEGDIRRMAVRGVGTSGADAVIPRRLELDLSISGCALEAVRLGKSVSNAVFRIREWDNGSFGLYLVGSANTATSLSFFDCDFRSGGVAIEHGIGGDWVVSDSTRGLTSKAPNVSAIGQVSQNLLVQWTPPLDGRQVVSYSVRYRYTSDTSWRSSSFTGTGRSTTLTGLNRGQGVEVSVGYQTEAGGTVTWAEPVWGVVGAANVLDDFNRSDRNLEGDTLPGGTLTPAWQTVTTTSGVMGIRNKLAGRVATALSGGTVFALIGTDKARGAVEVRVPSFHPDASSRRFGLVFGFIDTSNYYRLGCSPGVAGGALTVHRTVAGASEQVSVGPYPLPGDVLRVEWDLVGGNHFAWFVNGKLIASKVSETGLTTAGRIGLVAASTTDGRAQFDDFRAWV